MSEHKLPANAAKKKKWDELRGVDLRHKRYIWRSSTQGTFKYPASLYGALKSRREFKQARKYIKGTGLRGYDREYLMETVMGVVP